MLQIELLKGKEKPLGKINLKKSGILLKIYNQSNEHEYIKALRRLVAKKHV